MAERPGSTDNFAVELGLDGKTNRQPSPLTDMQVPRPAETPFYDRKTTPLVEDIPRQKANRGMLLTGLGLSLVWIGICAWYVTLEIGWSLLPVFQTVELLTGGAAFSTPLALIWLTVGYLDRGLKLQRVTERLEHHLRRLTYPEEFAELRVREIEESIRRQAEALEEATNSAVNKASALHAALGSKLQDLATLTDQIDVRSASASKSLDIHLQKAGESGKRALAISDTLKSVAEDAVRATDKAATSA